MQSLEIDCRKIHVNLTSRASCSEVLLVGFLLSSQASIVVETPKPLKNGHQALGMKIKSGRFRQIKSTAFNTSVQFGS